MESRKGQQSRKTHGTAPRVSEVRRLFTTLAVSRLRVVAAVSVLFALSWAVGIAAGKDNAATKPVLRIGLPSIWSSPDPSKDSINLGRIIRPLFIMALTHSEPDGSLTPALATSWRAFPGNKRFEFTLRHDVRFSDGTPVTAQAIKTWVDYFVSGNGPAISETGPVGTVVALGKWKLQLNMKSPSPNIPRVFSDENRWGDIMCPSAAANPSSLATSTCGAGPYQLLPSETVSGDHYTFVPNSFFYDKSKIRWSKVFVKIIPNPSSILQSMRAGELDFAVGDATTAGAAISSGIKVAAAPNRVQMLGFLDRGGTITKALGDARVRQALNYAIDRKAITQAIAGRWGSPTSQAYQPDAYDPKLDNYYAYNPEKAKSLLAAAGYPNGFTFNTNCPTFIGNAPPELCGAVAKYLDAVGVKLDISPSPTLAEFILKVRNPTFSSFIADLAPQGMWGRYWTYFGPKTSLNQHGWIDPTLNKLWLQGQRATDPEKYWLQMNRRIVTQGYWLPVIRADAVYFVGKVANVVLSKNGYTRYQPQATEWSPGTK